MDEAVDYFNVVNREQIAELYAKVHGSSMTDKSDCYKACYIIQTIFETYVVPILNANNPKQVKLEVEKTMIPTIQCSRKKYAAFIPMADKTLTKGLSNASRVAYLATKQILSRFLENTKKGFKLVDMYHYIGREILVPLMNGTIDLRLISKVISHNTTKKMTNKAQSLIQRLEDEGTQFMFDTVKEMVVNIEALDGDDGWSVITVDQFKNQQDGKYVLHVEKTIMDILQEFLTIISTTYTLNECAPFEALQHGAYDPELTHIEPGGGVYELPTHTLVTAKKRKRTKEGSFSDVVSFLQSEGASRAKRRRNVLPSSISLKD